MGYKKITELPDFKGKKVALDIQERGLKIVDGALTNANSVIVLGLIDLLVEKGVISDADTKQPNSKVKIIETRIHQHRLDEPYFVSLFFNNKTQSTYSEQFDTEPEAEAFAKGLRSGVEWAE